MLKKAWQLLELHFNECYEIVKNDEFYRGYASEKWRHSKQVAGAGNYIIPKIEWLQKKSNNYVEMVKTAVLLHDVCRFTEIEHSFNKKGKYDHGVGASILLRHTPMFNDIRIWLPIKHHGHRIEDLYNDEVYENIEDKGIQKEIELICFIIRDADKIANLNMLINEANIQHLFLGTSCGDKYKDGQISQIVKDSSFKEDTTPRFQGASQADHITGYLSWFFDINYQYSVDYCEKLNVLSGLFAMFDKYCNDEEFKSRYKSFVVNYVQNHQYLK
ncbi:MAG: HD domain-containing protein [Alphaproteobacteria bacterium]|nr:HD domain-containing protein [Alphaproteobacteria bacterium]